MKLEDAILFGCIILGGAIQSRSSQRSSTSSSGSWTREDSEIWEKYKMLVKGLDILQYKYFDFEGNLKEGISEQDFISGIQECREFLDENFHLFKDWMRDSIRRRLKDIRSMIASVSFDDKGSPQNSSDCAEPRQD